MAKLYRDNIFKLHGIPRKFIHDRGPQFASKFMNEFYRLLGIEANASTAYHPQTDGQTERINQEVEQYLRVWCHHRQDDWADLLALAEFNYNSSMAFVMFYFSVHKFSIELYPFHWTRYHIPLVYPSLNFFCVGFLYLTSRIASTSNSSSSSMTSGSGGDCC